MGIVKRTAILEKQLFSMAYLPVVAIDFIVLSLASNGAQAKLMGGL